MRTRASIESDVDLFCDDALDDPYPHYAALRDLGPATYLTCHQLWFLSRYEQVREALLDWKTFSSAEGVGLNEIINEAWAETVVAADPPRPHRAPPGLLGATEPPSYQTGHRHDRPAG